jgi:hypothetical protein
LSVILSHRKENGPVKGAIRLAASIRSLVVAVMVVVMMMMETVLMMLNVGLCTWDRAHRERNSSDGRQSESKFSHKNHSWAGFS